MIHALTPPTMRLSLVRAARKDDSLVTAIWRRAADQPASALPAADHAPDTLRLLASLIPHLAALAAAVQRRALYVRMLSDVHAPETQLLAHGVEEAGDAILVLGTRALKAHGAERHYDPERWLTAAREIGSRKRDRMDSPHADPAQLIMEAGEALAGAMYLLDRHPAGVPERIAALLGSVTVLLVWAR